MNTFTLETPLPFPAEAVWRWHQQPGALQRLSPPWERIHVLDEQGLGRGARTTLKTSLGPFSARWVAEHAPGPDPRSFIDRQVEGPFAHWEHRHRIAPAGETGSTLEDRIEYSLPFGWLGELFGGSYVRQRLERTFAWRARVLRQDLARHHPFASALEVALSGASGLVGSALSSFLRSGGHRLRPLVRRPVAAPGEIAWSPEREELDRAALEGLDAVVHLAGENIAARRWNARVRREIRESRVRGTALLARGLARLRRPPEVLVSASATGFYGDRPGEELDESSASGNGFLADLCREWEEAARPASEAGIRVVHLRIGVVLSPAGGALARMLPAFRLGAGGPIGSGRQIWSWIAIDDLLAAILFALRTPSLRGPVNAVSPHPLPQAEWSRILGRVLRRPAFLPLPAAAARIALGGMADELLLASADVRPRALEAAGFAFDHPELEPALRHLLGRPAPRG